MPLPELEDLRATKFWLEGFSPFRIAHHHVRLWRKPRRKARVISKPRKGRDVIK